MSYKEIDSLAQWILEKYEDKEPPCFPAEIDFWEAEKKIGRAFSPDEESHFIIAFSELQVPA